MKSHEHVNEKLLQMNKRWDDLKQNQREQILEMVRREHRLYVIENKQLPRQKYKDSIINSVYELIRGREVWIPFNEFYIKVSAYIDKLNRKTNVNFKEESGG